MIIDSLMPKTPQSPSTANLLPGVGWIYMSQHSRSGKGVSKSIDDAIRKCEHMASERLGHSVPDNELDTIENRLFANVECLRHRSPIIVAGDARKQAGERLRRELGKCFVIIYMKN
jgi:hypothetical protein